MEIKTGDKSRLLIRVFVDLYSKRTFLREEIRNIRWRSWSEERVRLPTWRDWNVAVWGPSKRRRKRRNVTGWLMHKRLPDNGKAARRFIVLRASTRQGCRCRASRWLIFGSLISLSRPIRGGHDWSSSPSPLELLSSRYLALILPRPPVFFCAISIYAYIQF